MKFSRRTATAFVLISIAISVAMGYGVSKLTTKVQYEQFLPETHPSVKTLKEYRERFPSASQVLLLIESENVAKKLAEYENVLEVSNSISEELLIIAKVIAEDQEKLHSFIANSVAPLPGVLRIRTSIITKKYKEESFPL